MPTFKFNRTSLAKLTPPEPDPSTGKTRNQEFHWDSQMPGFGVRITKGGSRSFIYETRVNGKRRRFTIGNCTAFTPEQARREAQAMSLSIRTGGDPGAERKRKEMETITLDEARQQYIKARKTLKPTTVADMQAVFRQVIPDWQGLPLAKITPDMVAKRHSQHGHERSEAKANAAMRYLRAIFNFAMAAYTAPDGEPLILRNPVDRLSQTRSWFENKRRQSVLTADQLKPWLTEVTAHPEQKARDFLLLLLFTGLRKTEALTLRWSDVDLTQRTLTVRDTKNHQDHTLPLPPFLFDLLQRRSELDTGSLYVFPGQGGRGHYKGPTKVLRNIKARTGLEITCHDLRRTFATIASSLNIAAYTLKALLNHKTGGDVTAGYIIRDTEALRRPMEMICDYIQKQGGLRESSTVVTLPGVHSEAV